MGFIEAYKHLEKLCGEILSDDRRISAYIDEMANTPDGSHFVSGWNDDLKRLKHYRRVRNQIVHDPGCNEANMCESGDVAWLENFYSRIINRTDPLALYAQATTPYRKQKPKPSDKAHEKAYTQVDYRSSKSDAQTGNAGLIVALLTALSIMALMIYKLML